MSKPSKAASATIGRLRSAGVYVDASNEGTIERVLDENKRDLVEALEQLAVHESGCASRRMSKRGPCNCMLERVLARHRPEE